MMIRNKGGMHGFTLVEIVIIIVVITILSLIGMVSYNGIRKNAAKSAVVSALSDAQKKLELEYAQTRTTMGGATGGSRGCNADPHPKGRGAL